MKPQTKKIWRKPTFEEEKNGIIQTGMAGPTFPESTTAPYSPPS